MKGIGCDGTTVNIAPGGLRGYLDGNCALNHCFLVFGSLSRAIIIGCFLHVLTFLQLMTCSCVYNTCMERCVEFAEVVDELRQCLDNSGMPARGNRPLQSSGTCFVAHKVAALGTSLFIYSFDFTDCRS